MRRQGSAGKQRFMFLYFTDEEWVRPEPLRRTWNPFQAESAWTPGASCKTCARTSKNQACARSDVQNFFARWKRAALHVSALPGKWCLKRVLKDFDEQDVHLCREAPSMRLQRQRKQHCREQKKIQYKRSCFFFKYTFHFFSPFFMAFCSCDSKLVTWPSFIGLKYQWNKKYQCIFLPKVNLLKWIKCLKPIVNKVVIFHTMVESASCNIHRLGHGNGVFFFVFQPNLTHRSYYSSMF